MESLWPIFEDTFIEENNTIQLLRFQASAIKKSTNGIINATFSKMTYKEGPIKALSKMSQAISAISLDSFEETLDEDLTAKEDINNLYKIEKYKFEIFNENYRFRIFELKYREMFPVSLIIDEDIVKGLDYKNGDDIYNNKDMEALIRKNFSSHKVRSVVSKMLQKAKKQMPQ